jgi:hypothetical protein
VPLLLLFAATAASPLNYCNCAVNNYTLDNRIHLTAFSKIIVIIKCLTMCLVFGFEFFAMQEFFRSYDSAKTIYWLMYFDICHASESC